MYTYYLTEKADVSTWTINIFPNYTFFFLESYYTHPTPPTPPKPFFFLSIEGATNGFCYFYDMKKEIKGHELL